MLPSHNDIEAVLRHLLSEEPQSARVLVNLLGSIPELKASIITIDEIIEILSDPELSDTDDDADECKAAIRDAVDTKSDLISTIESIEAIINEVVVNRRIHILRDIGPELLAQ